MKLPAGKLPPDLLRELLQSAPVSDSAVIVGGAVGEDAAALDISGPELLVVKTDPITFVGDDPGAFLLAVNGNDLATMGAEPRWLLVTALLPQGIREQEVRRLFQGVAAACTDAGVSLVGGHTEITVGLERPLLIGCLLGTVPRGKLIRTAGARPGDAVLLAGGIAIEGTAILAAEHAPALLAQGVPSEVIYRAAGWLRDPGISVLPAARAARTAPVHAMHDPTEGGLVTALRELAEAAGVGLRIDRDAIPVLPECRVICDALGLDPLGLLASGALLITLDRVGVSGALSNLQAAGVAAVEIGEVTELSGGLVFIENGGDVPMPVFPRDEIARFLEMR